MKKEILIFLVLSVALAGCDLFGLKSATDDGKKSLVSTPISVKDNQLLQNLRTLVEKADIGFDTLKNISSSTIAGIEIKEFTLWKSSSPFIKVEVLPKNNKSLVSINIHNYPAFPKGAYINEIRKTYEDGKLTGVDLIVITPEKGSHDITWVLLGLLIAAIVGFYFLGKYKYKSKTKEKEHE